MIARSASLRIRLWRSVLSCPLSKWPRRLASLISWLKQEGETVAKGEPLLEIETDKAVMEIESPGDGILAAVKVRAGAEVPVGQTIAWIVQPGETAPSEEARFASGRKTSALASSSASVSSAPSTQPVAADIRTSPKARRLAAERGVDLTKVRGSGPGGEILASDILAAAESKAGAAPVVDSSSPISRLMAREDHTELDDGSAFLHCSRSRRRSSKPSASGARARD